MFPPELWYLVLRQLPDLRYRLICRQFSCCMPQISGQGLEYAMARAVMYDELHQLRWLVSTFGICPPPPFLFEAACRFGRLIFCQWLVRHGVRMDQVRSRVCVQDACRMGRTPLLLFLADLGLEEGWDDLGAWMMRVSVPELTALQKKRPWVEQRFYDYLSRAFARNNRTVVSWVIRHGFQPPLDEARIFSMLRQTSLQKVQMVCTKLPVSIALAQQLARDFCNRPATLRWLFCHFNLPYSLPIVKTCVFLEAGNSLSLLRFWLSQYPEQAVNTIHATILYSCRYRSGGTWLDYEPVCLPVLQDWPDKSRAFWFELYVRLVAKEDQHCATYQWVSQHFTPNPEELGAMLLLIYKYVGLPRFVQEHGHQLPVSALKTALWRLVRADRHVPIHTILTHCRSPALFWWLWKKLLRSGTNRHLTIAQSLVTASLCPQECIHYGIETVQDEDQQWFVRFLQSQ